MCLYLVLGGIRSPYLGVQILGIMLCGFGFAAAAAHGLFRGIDDRDRNRRLGWFGGAAIYGLIGLTFYGWAWCGSPAAFWGLV